MNKATILVIDDEPQIRKLLEINLESNGYNVIQAASGKEGLLLAASHPPDLILLDIGLPDLSGHQVLKDLRAWYNDAIIILSVMSGEEDVVSALDNGANDYLTKPFRTAELLARIRSGIRRNQGKNDHSVAEFDEIQIDFIARSVKKNNEFIKLTSTEYKLLSIFARNEGCVLTHQYLLKEVWGIHHQNESQYLRVFVGTLRKKLETNPNQPVHIITESGVGYRFV
jgi:two-component system KDP operon response regulator KdpE